jgi:glycosyltransferase involved in cell wall biosynthesis
MRIALVGPTHPYKGGVAIHTTLLARRLAEAGHHVRLVSWSEQYPSFLYPGQQRVDEPEVTPYPATTYPLSWRHPLGWYATGRRLGRDHDVVVVVVVTTVQAPAWAALLAGARRGNRRVRLMALCHNVLPHERRRVDVPLTKAVLGRVGGVLVHTEREAETARALTGAPVRVAALPALLETSPDRVSAGTGLLFFGLVRHYKGLDVLLRALVLTRHAWQLVVAGEFWGGTADTEKLVAELGLADRVELRPGYRPSSELPSLFGAAAAVVLPYREATSSAVLTLAREYGVPAVATAVGSLATDVTEGVDGLLVPPEDPAALAAALDRLADPQVCASLRAGVRARPQDSSWDAYVAAVVAVGTEPRASSSRP